MVNTYKNKFNRKFKQPLDKSNSLDEIKKLTKIKKVILNKIVKRGEGAFYSNRASVRPHVKSATQWGIARVYSAVMNYYKWKKTGKEHGAFRTDRDLFEKYQPSLLKK